MNLPPLPPLPEPRLWYDPETGRASAMVPLRPTYESLFDDFDIRTYAEQYGRLCAEAERDRLQARVAELEVDAERLDWLVRYEAWVGWNREGEACRIWKLSDGPDDFRPEPVCGWDNFFDTYRAAIDTARKAKP